MAGMGSLPPAGDLSRKEEAGQQQTQQLPLPVGQQCGGCAAPGLRGLQELVSLLVGVIAAAENRSPANSLQEKKLRHRKDRAEMTLPSS